MSQQFRGGPTGGQVPSGPVKKAAIWIVIGTLILLFLIGLAVYATYCRANGKTIWKSATTTVEAVQISPRFGDTIVGFSTEWMAEPIKNVSGSIISHAHPLTKGVNYQVMIDDDTNKVYTFPAIDAPKSTTSTNMFNYTNMWSIARYRILPGQSKTTGKFLYTRDPG